MEQLQISDLIKLVSIVIPILFPALFIAPGILSFLTSQKHERTFLNKELQVLYQIIIIGVSFYLIPVSITRDMYENQNWIYTLFNQYMFYVLTAIFIGFIISLLFNRKMDFYISEEYRQFIKEKEYKHIIDFLLYYCATIFLYMFPLTTFYSLLIHTSMENSLDVAIPYIVIISFIYYFFLIPVIRIFKKLFSQHTPVSIRLKNGDTILNAFLLHPTYKKRILVGDHPNSSYCTKQVSISNDSIEYIEYELDKATNRDIKYKENKMFVIKKK